MINVTENLDTKKNSNGAKFSALAQNGSGTHPTFCSMGTGFFPGVSCGNVVIPTPHHF
jgi:hypothetical protein